MLALCSPPALRFCLRNPEPALSHTREHQPGTTRNRLSRSHSLDRLPERLSCGVPGPPQPARPLHDLRTFVLLAAGALLHCGLRMRSQRASRHVAEVRACPIRP